MRALRFDPGLLDANRIFSALRSAGLQERFVAGGHPGGFDCRFGILHDLIVTKARAPAGAR
jgi:hypothetical protein